MFKVYSMITLFSWMFIYLPRYRKFSAVISVNKFFAPFSLFHHVIIANANIISYDDVPSFREAFISVFWLSFFQWVIVNDLFVSSQFLFSAQLHLLLLLSVTFLNFIHFILQLEDFYLFLFYNFDLSFESIVLLHILFLIALSCGYIYFCRLLNFLRTIILNYLSVNLQISIPLQSLPGKSFYSFDGVIFP